MQLENATYEELIDELGKRSEYSPNQIVSGLSQRVMAISQKRAIINNAHDTRMLISKFREEKKTDDLTDFNFWLIRLIQRTESEISEIEHTL